jgi:hypothetical protein
VGLTELTGKGDIEPPENQPELLVMLGKECHPRVRYERGCSFFI